MSPTTTGLGAGVTRRMVQTPQMRARVVSASRATTEEVHQRRVMEWANSSEGSFPRLDDSRRQAIAELTILCEALGELAAISPTQYDYAAKLYGLAQPKPEPEEYYYDFDPDWDPYD